MICSKAKGGHTHHRIDLVGHSLGDSKQRRRVTNACASPGEMDLKENRYAVHIIGHALAVREQETGSDCVLLLSVGEHLQPLKQTP